MANTTSAWQYVVVTGPLRGLRDAFWKVERNVKMSCLLRGGNEDTLVSAAYNTWHYVIIRYSYGELPKFGLRCSYKAALHKGVTTAFTSRSLSRKSPCGALAGQIYVKV